MELQPQGIDFTGFRGVKFTGPEYSDAQGPYNEGHVISRQTAMQRMDRYVGDPKSPYVPLMHYRSNNWVHQLRMLWRFNDLVPVLKQIYPDLDIEQTRALIAVHDDSEHDPYFMDVQLAHKVRMTPAELAEVAKRETEAMVRTAGINPPAVNGYSYLELMRMALDKDTLPGWVESLIDKLDGYCESTHENLAGTPWFYKPMRGYTDMLWTYADKYPGLKPLLDAIGDELLPTRGLNFEELGQRGKLHTEENILLPTGIPTYDRWKALHLENGGTAGLDLLIKIKEDAFRPYLFRG